MIGALAKPQNHPIGDKPHPIIPPNAQSSADPDAVKWVIAIVIGAVIVIGVIRVNV